MAIVLALVLTPLIAVITKGKYYLRRTDDGIDVLAVPWPQLGLFVGLAGLVVEVDLADGADLLAVGGEDVAVLQLVESGAIHDECSF